MGWPAIISTVLSILGKSNGDGKEQEKEPPYQYRVPEMPQKRQQVLGNPNYYRMMGR